VNGGGVTIFASRYTAGGTWNTPEIMTGTSFFADAPHIAMDPSGNALLPWTQTNGAFSSVSARRYVSGRGWGDYFQVQATAPSIVGDAQLAIDHNGSAFAIWARSNGTTGFDLLASKFE
jgi:hypothetical protein